ncbi:MAG: mevalonate kinase [Chloroflexota bacterium]
MKASAPGKVILFGEHAVVYGRPAVAVPVTQVRVEVDVAASPRPGIWIEAPDIRLSAELKSLPNDHPLAALMHNLLFALAIDPYPDLTVRISSTIPVASGLGSGAAVSVALIRALASTLGRPLADDQVSAYAFEIEKLHHGTPSGIDNSVIAHARPVYFVKGRPIEMLHVREPFTVVIGHTGVPAPTRESVADVRRLWESDPAALDVVLDGIGAVARMAREAIETGMWRHLGPLMNENHALLQRLTVSSPELDRLVLAARRAGALGAKLSGGGRGGNMIALAPASPAADNSAVARIEAALMAAGARLTVAESILPDRLS